jgi:malate dehydrogenase (oxaloacetate-decarboxylating)
VAAATVISAINAAGAPLEKQKFVVVGFGSAGLGIANLLVPFLQDKGLTEREARSRFYAIDRFGLLTENGKYVRPEQLPFARREQEVQTWRSPNGEISLFDVVRNAKPSVLIGVSGQPRLFTEQVVREMARHTSRPVIFPLSNPTSCSEACAQDLMDWTEGRALIGTGSPFNAVNVGDKKILITQINNSYVFPGLALGIIAAKAGRVTDSMIKAGAEELERQSPAQNDQNASLLPPISEARRLARFIAKAVGMQAIRDGQSELSGEKALDGELQSNIWEPRYVPYEPKR